jgi:peptidoglycan biosynthesis protein MviN/MurJ (putative lipid II flippase)
MRKILKLLIFLPLGICIIALAIANRGLVVLSLDPLAVTDPVLSLKLPLFVFLILALMIGVLIGGFAMWLTQGKHRKNARILNKETVKLKNEMVEVKANFVQLPAHIG